MTTPTIAQVEAKLDELISRHQRLQLAYAELKQQEKSWTEERQRLTEKNEVARSRIKTMIENLKGLESDTE